MSRLSSLSLVAFVLLSGGAVAQTPSPGTTTVPPVITGPSTTAPTGSGGGASGGSIFANVQPTELMASNLIDLDVYNPQNEKIGEVEDLVLDSGRAVRALVIGVGGFLGVGERYVAVDPSAVQVTRNANGSYRAVISATAEQLKAAPEFKYRGAWTE